MDGSEAQGQGLTTDGVAGFEAASAKSLFETSGAAPSCGGAGKGVQRPLTVDSSVGDRVSMRETD